ncbi:alpha/beta fold hydrolase [Hyphococcus flavus]|uniref:Alpha/beta fold hydrolase n=1 Tax=Hyphococcus flavus TaxID=1866326 RepID=A0AAF0CE41_9PROT|nr:alpha/beta fold hydrolase [Hyphococcus flavus]WDI30656.1 alpha/beta fold hydrolase [Hyphococcus flavus]
MSRLFPIVIFLLVLAAGAGFLLFHQNNGTTKQPQVTSVPQPYKAETLQVQSHGVTLAGELIIPDIKSPAPAAILLSVAGPNDRNQSFAGHKSFTVLADVLERRGIASARFDDRGVGGSGGDYFKASWNDLSNDAAAIFETLKNDPRIDPNQIGFIGMSQGGAVAAMTANAVDSAAFAVLISAPGLSGVETLSLQLEKALEISGVTGDRADQYRTLFAEYISIVTSNPEAPATRDRLAVFLKGPGRALIPPYSFVPETLEGRIEMFLGPWYQSNLRFDPEPIYSSLDVPILAIGGGLDPISPPEHHLEAIEQYLRQAPSSDVTVRIIPDANHIMQKARTGLPAEYAGLENTLSPDLLEILGAWLDKRLNNESMD